MILLTRRVEGLAHRDGPCRMFSYCSIWRAMRFAPEILKFKALAALEEAALRTHEAPVRPTHSLRFALAFLYAVSDGGRWPYDHFWKAVTRGWGEDETPGAAAIGRSQSANASLNAIYRSVRVQRRQEFELTGRI